MSTIIVIEDLMKSESLDAQALSAVTGGHFGPLEHGGPFVCGTPYLPMVELPDIHRIVADHIADAQQMVKVEDPYVPGGPQPVF